MSLTNLTTNVDRGTECQCNNCDWIGTANDVKPIHDIEIRIDPGSEVPVGECPQCGALAYLTILPEAKRREVYVVLRRDESGRITHHYSTDHGIVKVNVVYVGPRQVARNGVPVECRFIAGDLKGLYVLNSHQTQDFRRGWMTQMKKALEILHDTFPPGPRPT